MWVSIFTHDAWVNMVLGYLQLVQVVSLSNFSIHGGFFCKNFSIRKEKKQFDTFLLYKKQK